MKKLFALFTLALFTQFLMAQTTQNTTPGNGPSANMQAAFTKLFPGATSVFWQTETPGQPVATFTFNNHKMEALFGDDGSLVWKKTMMTEDEFPKISRDFMSGAMNPCHFERFYHLESPKTDDLECELTWNGHLYLFQFDASGKELNRKALK